MALLFHFGEVVLLLWVNGRPDGHRLYRRRTLDGVMIPYREWRQGSDRAVLLYLHGQGGHSGAFTAMGDRLHEGGLAVYAHDQRGFGLSTEPRGDISSYDQYIRDAEVMVDLARRKNPGKPLFLLGYSMGGHIAARLAFRRKGDIAGLVALSPGFKLRHSPPWSVVVRAVIGLLSAPGRCLPPIGGEAPVTRNPVEIAGALQDERWVRAYTPRFHFATLRSLKAARHEIARLELPVLFLQAGEDQLVCPAESRRVFDLIPAPDRQFRLLQGLSHNLVAEPEMPDVAQEICDWITARV